MAIKIGDRYSRFLFPPSLEELVGENDPVRVYDAFVDNLNFKTLGIEIDENQVGAPSYDPVAMLKLLVYGYSYGFRSSRRLERATYHNMSFVWLLGGLRPDHKTIAEFRRRNRGALKEVLKQCVRLCMKLDLIDGNTLFLDGSKMRANASMEKFWTVEKCEKYLKKLDEKIEQLLNECERHDNAESQELSLVKLKEELSSKKELQSKVKSILSELEEKGLKCLNSTDSDCVPAKGRQGTHASYNTQCVTDKKEGLIVNCDSVSSSNDTNQFSTQILQAEEVMEKECQEASSDAGYSQLEDLEKIASRGTEVIVPNQKQASKKEVGAFDKSKFKYDEETDEYICPANNRLSFTRIMERDKVREYRMVPCSICLKCNHYGVCTTAKRGRTISRLFNEELKLSLEAKYASKEGQEIYKHRKSRAELPFGYIKRVLDAGYFLLRGREGVNAEMALLCNSFNLKRAMNLIGIPALLAILRGT